MTPVCWLCGRAGRAYLRQHSLRQRGTVFLGGMQLMIEENDIISQQVPGLMSGCGCWRIRGLKSRRQNQGYFTGTVSPPGLHCARATLAGFIHACYSRQPELAAKLMKMLSLNPTVNGYCLVSGRRGGGRGNRRGSERYLRLRPDFVALCDKPDTAQRVADWLGKNTCKIRKVLFIFAGWIRRAHDTGKLNETLQSERSQ